LLIEQLPTTKLLLVLTFRPEFHPPWQPRSHISQLVLNRLGKKQVEAMIAQAAGTELPPDVIEQIRLKTDGVPLFVEEVTKTVVESVESVGATGQSPLQFAIPATLQEALLARLDRLSEARQVAQLGATLGREFSHEILQAVSPLSETDLQSALTKLVEAEIVYQRGVGEQARYFFKHALIQDTAYQSLLKSTRLQYHQQIAQVLEERFPDLKAKQPELLAHHYTEANLIEQALPYWQQAGRRASQRLANVEAVTHLRRGLTLLETLPETPERNQHELTLQATLGPVLIQTQGWSAPETGAAYTRAAALCQQLGETAQRFPVLYGLRSFQHVRADYQTARKLGEQLLHLAKQAHDPALLVEAHYTLGNTLFFMGELGETRRHCEQSVAHYNPQQHRSLSTEYGHDPAMSSLATEARALWVLGYPEQALRQSQASVAHARRLAHPFSLAFALGAAIAVHQYRREWDQAQEQAEAGIALATEQGFPFWVAQSTVHRGRAVAEHGRAADGIEQICWGITAIRDTGTEGAQSLFLCMLAEVYLHDGQVEEGLATVAEALAFVDRTDERFYEAELYRLKGTLTLQSKVASQKSKDEESEGYFLKAIDIAQKQQAKSWELRASTSLARLWQRQGKQKEAHEMLAEVYGWFTEGFDTKDLQEAKTLLEELEGLNG
jgi:predicted ATPase